MGKMSDKEYYYLLFLSIGLIIATYTYGFITEERGEKTETFTFFYVEPMDENVPEYFVMTLEYGEVYFRGNISEPKTGARYRITYVVDRSVKVRRYVVKKCEAIG